MACPPPHLPPDRPSYQHDPLASLQSPTSINASRKALLVENDESLRRLLRTRFEREGYAVRIAFDCREALRLYDTCAPFFVVVINYCLPMSGVALTQSIRERNPSQTIVVAAFDYGDEEEVPLPEDLADIPLLTDTSQLSGLFRKIRYWATRDDVCRAIDMLTTAEWLKLQKFAEYRVRAMGRAARSRTGKDLLQEVLLRTVQGAEGLKGRHWNTDVDFFNYLVWAIRSTADNWRKQQQFDADIYFSSELITEQNEERESAIDLVASQEVPADQHLIVREKKERLLAVFDRDPEAQQLLHALLAGMKKNEILSRYAITEKRYSAALKRIRRKLLG